MRSKQRTRLVAVAAIPILYLSLTYFSWWMSVVGSVLIVLLSKIAWPRRGTAVIGLKMSAKELGLSVLLFGIVLLGSFWLVETIVRREGIQFAPFYKNEEGWLMVIHTIGQTLNEELVLGALLLLFIRSRFKTVSPLLISAGAALVFCLFHSAFFGLRPPQAPNYGSLSLATLLSLFLVGVTRNNCILSTNHIGYAWAIHLGWNIAFMNGSFYWPGSNTKLIEPAMFNLILGDGLLLVVTTMLMILSLTLFLKEKMWQAILPWMTWAG
jgi:hypothetical protein